MSVRSGVTPGGGMRARAPPLPADNSLKQIANREGVEQLRRRSERLVRQHGETGVRTSSIESVENAVVDASVIGETRIVDLQKPHDRVLWMVEASGVERTLDE